MGGERVRGLGSDLPFEGPGPDEHLGQQAATSVLWLTARAWIVRVGGVVTVAILTRLLSPEDFGLVAAALTVLPLIYLISDLGFSTYIVQTRDPTRQVLSTGFWFSVVVGGLFCLVLTSGSTLLADLFHLPGVAPVFRWFALSVVFVALGSVPTAIMRRRMAFRALAVQGGVAALVAQVVAVVMSLNGAGVWALVAQSLVAQALMCVMVWVSARWVPALTFSAKDFVVMVRFGGQVVAVEFVAMARVWMETAIIVWSLGAPGLGYYNIAQRLIQVLQDLSASALVPVSIVTFARLQAQKDRLRAAYLRALGVTYAAVAPVLTFVAVGAPQIVPILFGSGWESSVVVVQALAVAGIMTLGASLDHGLFYGAGKPGRWLVYALFVDVATVATTAFSVRYGLVGVAVGFVLVALVATGARWLIVSRLLGARVSMVWKPFRALSIEVLLSACVGFGALQATTEFPSVLSLGLAGVVIVTIHAVAVRLLTPALFVDVLNQIPPRAKAWLMRRPISWLANPGTEGS